MDVTMDQLIDTGLNMLGFLVAGGLMLVLLSIFRPRTATPPASEASPELPTADETPADRSAATPVESTAMTFVSLAPPGPSDETTRPVSPATEEHNRDRRCRRADAIRLARDLIAAREPKGAIAEKLPLAEAELALLSRQQD